MVINIGDVNLSGIPDVGQIAFFQLPQNFPQRPYLAVKKNQFPFGGMNILHGFRLGCFDNFIFQRVDYFIVMVQGHKVMIHDHIEQGIGQVVPAALADFPFPLAQPVFDHV